MGRRFYHGGSSHECSEGREKAGRLVLRHRDEVEAGLTCAMRLRALWRRLGSRRSSASSTRATRPRRARRSRISARRRPCRCDYVQPATRGLTVQRNVGIDRTSGDPVFLIDDDVWLNHDSARRDPRRVRALGSRARRRARVARSTRPTRPRRRSSGAGSSAWAAGGRRPAGACAAGSSSRRDLARRRTCGGSSTSNGWFMSYRREVFDKVRFDEKLVGYACKEDVDFSYRVVAGAATSSSRRLGRPSCTI